MMITMTSMMVMVMVMMMQKPVFLNMARVIAHSSIASTLDSAGESNRRRASGNEETRNGFHCSGGGGRIPERGGQILDARTRRDFLGRLPRRQNRPDLQVAARGKTRPSAIVFLDEVREVLVRFDRDQGLQVSVRQLTLQIYGKATKLS
ncbi:hypothetical protein PanWU01x14_066680 [Parasponia andersonii]|uniref:Uncharacterized protein n=1 Tax=Parasponia andersonii TaxID=3476 RepID=A0A2P5DG72_PARAD|nr:hypothetical protein PanWU01x14_066680 [Parasponia andersonii]